MSGVPEPVPDWVVWWVFVFGVVCNLVAMAAKVLLVVLY